MAFETRDGRLYEADPALLAAAFHRTHERIYTIKDDNDVVEYTTWKVRAIGETGGAARLGAPLPAQRGDPRPKGHRLVHRGRDGRQRVPVYDGGPLGAGASVAGPALIEETTTTILLLDGQVATTDRHGNYLVEVRA